MTCPERLAHPKSIGVEPRGHEGQMKRVSFLEEQILGAQKEAEASAKASGMARRHGLLVATIITGSHSMAGWGHVRVEIAA